MPGLLTVLRGSGASSLHQWSGPTSWCACVLVLLVLSCVARCHRRRWFPVLQTCMRRMQDARSTQSGRSLVADARDIENQGGVRNARDPEAAPSDQAQREHERAIEKEMASLRSRQWEIRAWQAEAKSAQKDKPSRAAVPPFSKEASLQDKVYQLMIGQEACWDALSELLAQCPINEREGLLCCAMSVASARGQGFASLVERIAGDDVQCARSPMLIAPQDGLAASFLKASRRLLGPGETFCDAQSSALVKTVGAIEGGGGEQVLHAALHRAVDEYISSIAGAMGRLPGVHRLVLHFVHIATDRKFGAERARNGVVKTLLAYVLAPSLGRVAENAGMTERLHVLCQMVQKISEYIFYDDPAVCRVHGGVPPEEAYINHVEKLRLIADRVYWLPVPDVIDLGSSADEAGVAAEQLVHMCRSWASSGSNDGLAKFAKPFAELLDAQEREP